MNYQKQVEETKVTDKDALSHHLSRYECYICLEVAREPVITPCGHLFCWPCIYKWFQMDTEVLACPVCKNGISEKTVIPLYTKDEDPKHDAPKLENRPANVPNRPTPLRQAPERNTNSASQGSNIVNRTGAMNLQLGVTLAGYGFFPSLFNLLFQIGNKIDDSDMEQQSPEVALQLRMRALFGFTLILAVAVLIFV